MRKLTPGTHIRIERNAQIVGLGLLCGLALLCLVAWTLARAAREHPLPPGPGDDEV